MGPPSLRLANPIWRPGAINLHPGPKTVQNHRIPGISGRISRKTNENWCAFGHKLMLCLGELLVVVCFRVRLLSRDLLLLLGSRDFAFKCCSQLIIYKYHIFPVRLVGCMLFEAPFVNPRCVGTSAKNGLNPSCPNVTSDENSNCHPQGFSFRPNIFRITPTS